MSRATRFATSTCYSPPDAPRRGQRVQVKSGNGNGKNVDETSSSNSIIEGMVVTPTQNAHHESSDVVQVMLTGDVMLGRGVSSSCFLDFEWQR